MGKRAFITGILGQDGTYLARFLLSKGYEVHGLIRLPFDREERRIRSRFPSEAIQRMVFHTGALEDPGSLSSIVKTANPEEIYHLAGVSDSRQSFLIPEQTIQSITLGTLRLLECARLHNPASRIFLASSCEKFGTPVETPQTEQTPFHPATPYGIAKQAADGFAEINRQRYQQFIAVGILYNHESPLRPANYLSRRVSQSIAAIKRGELKKLALGDLTAERDWSDARDFVRGYWHSLQAAQSADYIFASGKSHTVKDLVEVAFRSAGLDYKDFVDSNSANVPTSVKGGLCGNTLKTEKVLGWQRQWTFERMIEDMVAADVENRPELERAKP